MNVSFLSKFKRQTESKWVLAQIDPEVYGFQIQPGTKWNAGLSNEEIDKFQAQVGIVFPNDLRLMLAHFNGTDLPALNVYGSSGEPHRTAHISYAFPRDLKSVTEKINAVQVDRKEIADVLFEDEQYELDPEASLLPIYGHRFVVCSPDLTQSRVLSIVGTDVVTYGLCLKNYLTAEFLT